MTAPPVNPYITMRNGKQATRTVHPKDHSEPFIPATDANLLIVALIMAGVLYLTHRFVQRQDMQ